MANRRSETFDKPEGLEIPLACSTCHRKTAHGVLLIYTVDESVDDGNYSTDWTSIFQTVKCQGCKTVSFRKVTFGSEDFDHDQDGNMVPIEYEQLFPPRAGDRKGLEDERFYLPLAVRRIYDETQSALVGDLKILAGIGVRALIEAVCKEKEAIGNNLELKIDDLKVKDLLTADGASILHQIRNLGNAAAHEIVPHTTQQLGLALDVVDNLLTAVYVLPEKAKEIFPEAKPKQLPPPK